MDLLGVIVILILVLLLNCPFFRLRKNTSSVIAAHSIRVLTDSVNASYATVTFDFVGRRPKAAVLLPAIGPSSPLASEIESGAEGGQHRPPKTSLEFQG